jgi:hypothetical protein
VNANGELVLTNADSGNVGFNVNASRKMTILSSGNVVLVQITQGLLWKCTVSQRLQMRLNPQLIVNNPNATATSAIITSFEYRKYE